MCAYLYILVKNQLFGIIIVVVRICMLFLTNTHLRESMKRGVYVDGLSEHIVSSAKEAYQVSLIT